MAPFFVSLSSPSFIYNAVSCRLSNNDQTAAICIKRVIVSQTAARTLWQPAVHNKPTTRDELAHDDGPFGGRLTCSCSSHQLLTADQIDPQDNNSCLSWGECV